MTYCSHVYIVTRRKGEAVDLLDAHRKLEHARKQIAALRDEYKAQGSRTVLTESGCCLRTQKGGSVIYYEINKMELK